MEKLQEFGVTCLWIDEAREKCGESGNQITEKRKRMIYIVLIRGIRFVVMIGCL